MREHCQHEAASRQAYGRLTWLVRVIGNWRMRSELKRLQGFSDYQLRDVGLSYDDIRFLSSRPLGADWAWELERRNLLTRVKV